MVSIFHPHVHNFQKYFPPDCRFSSSPFRQIYIQYLCYNIKQINRKLEKKKNSVNFCVVKFIQYKTVGKQSASFTMKRYVFFSFWKCVIFNFSFMHLFCLFMRRLFTFSSPLTILAVSGAKFSERRLFVRLREMC